MVSHPLVKGCYHKTIYLEVCMTELSPLIAILTTSFDWHGARITFVAQFLVALIRVRTVNLTEIATAFCGDAKIESHYRRIQRFFKEFSLSRSQVAAVILRLLPLGEKWILCLDRTNWQFGVMNINILVLAVAYHGVAIPLLWMLLDKRGNSHTLERIALLKHFLVEFGHEHIHCVTADREFIGTDWIKFLKRHRIRFRIRIRHNTNIGNTRNTYELPASRFFRHLPLGEVSVLPTPRRVWGMTVWVIGVRVKDDYLILITDQQPHTALDDYRQRWQIETLFGCLKSRGFDFEATHLTEPDRISKLLVLLTLAFCWCSRLGEWQHDQKPIPVKTHGRPAKSLFRHGLDTLRNIVSNLTVKEPEFCWATAFLRFT
jgi:Transposase DDE domain